MVFRFCTLSDHPFKGDETYLRDIYKSSTAYSDPFLVFKTRTFNKIWILDFLVPQNFCTKMRNANMKNLVIGLQLTTTKYIGRSNQPFLIHKQATLYENFH